VSDKKHEGRKVPINGGGQHNEGEKPLEGSGEALAEERSVAELMEELEKTRAELTELEKIRAEAKEAQDKYLRLYAETENYKKRMSRDAVEGQKYYNEWIIKDLLPVMDNLERALSHAGEDDPLIEGVRMVKKQFMDVLAKYGVTQVESVGLQFDPEKQQAIMQVETEDYEPGTVVEEFQRGYFLNERILRPAMVTVAKRPAENTGE
jgi:molecular chaperone GrpE